MHEIRLVGRGGHGVVTAGELLGEAAVRQERYAQAIPNFGPERRGALSACTLRIADEPILLKCSSTQPDVVVIFDPTIWHHAPVTLGLKEGGTIVLNTPRDPDEVKDDLRSGRHGPPLTLASCAIWTVDATGIALEALGRPITNTAMMGALAGATGVLGLAPVEEVLRERFGARADSNVEAARAGCARLRRAGD
jgi:pyruvate ferredoxin oxidoreductase gamma subunit/2-oxoisovalerate ferredoxin oxidoreductase gamma subunit